MREEGRRVTPRRRVAPEWSGSLRVETPPSWEMPLSSKTRQGAGASQQHHHDPWRQLPDGEKQEARERERKIARRQDRTGPDRAVEGRTENADYGCVRAAHGGLCC